MNGRGYIKTVGTTICPVCNGAVDFIQRYDETGNNLLAAYSSCPHCGTFPLMQGLMTNMSLPPDEAGFPR